MEEAIGKVLIGFSRPYVALYSIENRVTAYTNGRRLARGVGVDLDVETADRNGFYADNHEVESEEQIFVRGTANLTVDGLLLDAKKMVLGMQVTSTETIEETEITELHHSEDQQIPYVGIGYIEMWRCNGKTTYTGVILTKAKFADPSHSAETKGEMINWQTQELSAELMRDGTVNNDWQIETGDLDTEDLADAWIRKKFNITAAAGE